MRADAPKSREKVLVAQLARFGDFLQTTPLLRAIKHGDPEAELWVMVDAAQAGLASGNPDVDRVLAVDLPRLERTALSARLPVREKIEHLQRLLGNLAGLHFDRLINLNTSGVAALLCELPKAERREGPRLAPDRRHLITAPWAGLVLNLMSRRRLIRFNLVDLLASYAGPGGRVSDGLVYPLREREVQSAVERLGPARGRPLVGFQVGSRHPARQWPPAYFAHLADFLKEELKARIVLLGATAERLLGRAVIEAMAPNPGGRDGVLDLMGRTSLEELAGVLSRLDLVVTADTGTMHLAAAVGAPLLALFMGPAFCHETGPYGRGHVVLQGRLDCSPCTEDRPSCTDHACRWLITPAAVFRTARWILLDREGRPPSERELGPGVELLVSDLDRFGVVYRPRLWTPLSRTEVLALAYREAGRGLMRPSYLLDAGEIAEELAGYRSKREVDLSELEENLARGAGLAGDPDLEPFRKTTAGLAARGEAQAAKRFRRDMAFFLEAAGQAAGRGPWRARAGQAGATGRTWV
ncbi:MAG: glycosyltransferase family 9 protein [Thermodesulfobacteriota bacterium]